MGNAVDYEGFGRVCMRADAARLVSQAPAQPTAHGTANWDPACRLMRPGELQERAETLTKPLVT